MFPTSNIVIGISSSFLLLLLSFLALRPPMECQQQQCPANETYRECASACEPKCGMNSPSACIMMCMPAQCQCSPGYVRNAAGQCVLPADCPDQQQQQQQQPGMMPTQNPCAAMTCPVGQVCHLQQVQCIRAPCPPIAQCVPASWKDVNNGKDRQRSAGGNTIRIYMTFTQHTVNIKFWSKYGLLLVDWLMDKQYFQFHILPLEIMNIYA